MEFWTRVRGWLRARAGAGREPLWVLLRERGGSREVVRFAQQSGPDIAHAWAVCPRPSWAVEIAARAGIDRGQIHRAVEALATSSSEDERLVGLHAVAVDEGRMAARSFAAGELPLEALVDATEALCSALVESRAEIQQRYDDQPRHGSIDVMVAARDAADELYAEALRALADVVKLHISAHEVRISLEGMAAHPYR